MEVKVTSKGDGLHSCSYTPVSPIKHTLAITWGGVGIPKSPFRVSSQSQRRVTTGGSSLARAPGRAALVCARDVDPEFLFKAERIEVVSGSAETVQPRTKDKPKKPLIIIVTCTEEKYSF